MTAASRVPTMRVALVASSYEPHVGGVEQHVRSIAREFVGRGIDVEVWTVDRGERLGDQLVDGIRVRYLPTPLPARDARALAGFVKRFPRAWRRWRQASEQFRPDLLHVHCFGPNGLYALTLHRRLGIPLAVTSHGETLGDDTGVFTRSALLRRGLREAIERSVFVTAPSRFVLDGLRAYGLTEGAVVSNGVDPDVGPPGALTETETYILGVGRLGRMKGFDLLIDAFARSGLANDHRLVIGGDGPERDSLERHATACGLQNRVRFVGQLAPAEVASAMAGARLVAVPSRTEAFGIVALETWRAGTALVMTSHGGAAEFVRDNRDGLLVDPTDVAAFAEALRAVATDDALRDRLAAAGRCRVTEFSWGAVADGYLEHYAGVHTQGALRA